MNGLFRHAHKVFDKMPQWLPLMIKSLNLLTNYTTDSQDENVVAWTSKISGLVRRNKPGEAIGLFKAMLTYEQKPNYVTILSLIRAVGSFGNRNLVEMIHGYLLKMDFEAEVSVVTALIGFYSGWDYEVVWKLFDQVYRKDVFLWSAMISVCAKSGKYDKAFEICREMQYKGVQPNYVSIVSVLPVCAATRNLSHGKAVHGYSIKKMEYTFTNVQNSLVDMYVKCGRFKTAVQVFNNIVNKDIVSWRTMIHGCIHNECPKMALRLFYEFQKYSCRRDENLVLDVIGACEKARNLKLGYLLHGYILKCGFLVSVSIVTSLLQMYARFGIIESSRILFSHIHQRDVIAWSAMVSAYALTGHPLHALHTFKQMHSTNEKPNEITFASLLHASSCLESQVMGESIHALVTRSGYLSNEYITSALIDLYCKFGSVGEGEALFDGNSFKDLVGWSSMINGYGINGYGNEALETFSRMLKHGILPNEVVFISLLSACSHCGLEQEGWYWFYTMKNTYNITPTLAHYACMVDLLSRQGHVKEALDFVQSMPVEPDKRIWGAVLAGCRSTCGYIEVAEFVVEQLTRLDPENKSCYVVLSNLYAEQCRWDDVENVRKFVNDKGLMKETGYSSVEANHNTCALI